MIAKATVNALRGPKYGPDDGSRADAGRPSEAPQGASSLSGKRICKPRRAGQTDRLYGNPRFAEFGAYARKAAREREVAEGFIGEMAKRVAGDKALDLEGMKQAVRNAIEIYEKEIAGRPIETNLDKIVGRALTRAKEQVDCGQSGLARAKPAKGGRGDAARRRRTPRTLRGGSDGAVHSGAGHRARSVRRRRCSGGGYRSCGREPRREPTEDRGVR